MSCRGAQPHEIGGWNTRPQGETGVGTQESENSYAENGVRSLVIEARSSALFSRCMESGAPCVRHFSWCVEFEGRYVGLFSRRLEFEARRVSLFSRCSELKARRLRLFA